MGFPGGSVLKKPPANAGDSGDVGLIPGSGRSPRTKWQPIPVILHGKFHGQRSLAGFIPLDQNLYNILFNKVDNVIVQYIQVDSQ